MLGFVPIASAPLGASGGTAAEAPAIRPSGIASAEALGALLLRGIPQIQPSGIATQEAFAAPRLLGGNTIYPDGIVSAEAFATAQIGLTVQLSGLASAETFGAPSIAVTLLIAAAGIGSAEAVGAPGLAEVQSIAPTGIAAASTVGSLALLDRQRIAPDGIPSSAAFGAERVSVVFVLTLTGIPSSAACGVPIVQRAGRALTPPNVVQWTAVVTLGTVDVSAQLVGAIAVDVKEGAARLADFTLVIAAGTPINLPQYTGQPVTIDFAEADGSSPVRMFTGVVELPDFDFHSRTISFRCTDDLPGAVAAMTRAAIDQLIGGEYSAAVFAPTADQWQYARDRLQTCAGSLDLSPLGVARFTPWVAATSADYAFTAADLLYDAEIKISLANRSAIKNRVVIDYAYRFPLLKRRSLPIEYLVDGYFGAAVWADFVALGRWTLSRAAVREVLSGTGWVIVNGDAGLVFDAAPDSGTYQDALGTQYIWNNTVPGSICVGFSATLTKCYAQWIDEYYTLIVENAASVAALGILRENLQSAMAVEFDVAAWEASANLQPTGGSYDGDAVEPTLPAMSTDSGYWDAWATLGDTSLGHGESARGYFPSPETDRTAAASAIRTLVAQAQTSIYASHRLNAVRFTVPLVAALDPSATIAVSAPSLAVRGKVRNVEHRMEIESGVVTSAVELAICALNGLGTAHEMSPAEAPAPPAAILTPAFWTSANAITAAYQNLPADDHVLTVTVPGVEPSSRNHYRPAQTAGYAARIVEDLFVMTS